MIPIRLVLFTLVVCVAYAAVRDCSIRTDNNRVYIENGYVHLEYNLVHPSIDIVSADFEGQGKYGKNLMANGQNSNLFRNGILLEHDLNQSGKIISHTSSRGKGSSQSVKILSNTTATVKFQVLNVVDDFETPLASSNWTIALNAGQRYFTLNVTVISTTVSPNTINLRVSQYFSPTMSLGQFDKGVQQQMNSTNHYFASKASLFQYYALGETGSVTTVAKSPQKVLLSSEYADKFFRSGIHHVLHGSFPSTEDKWSNITLSTATPLSPGITIPPLDEVILVNNFDFPVMGPHVTDNSGVDMPVDHIRSFYTGVYASPVAALVSFDIPDGVISPTLATPHHSYWPLFNFYDPDSWMSNSAMVYLADPYLFTETRKMLDTSLRYVLPSGQLPHHFIGFGPIIRPTYEAISGATQTGPNIFWTLAALQYVKASGDYDWLKRNQKGVELVVKFITDRYSSNFQLLKAPGPLQIDVFIRNNYTSDTNAMMTFVLTEMAEAEEFLGDHDKAAEYREMSSNIIKGLNRWLWKDDHFITQINDDFSMRDFVDYDANFLIVAFENTPRDRATAIMKRLMNGKCTNADVKGGKPRAAYVSEIYYDASNCYGGNVGDSAVTMGRIGWAEAHALKQMGDLDTFYNVVLNPLIGELLQHTWLYERYTCDSVPTHNPFYIEYPELVVMLLREIVYGIHIGLNTVRIQPHLPSGTSSYKYRIGSIRVDYDKTRVSVTAPGSGNKSYLIFGVVPNSTFTLSVTMDHVTVSNEDVKSDAQGVLKFIAPLGLDHVVMVQKK